MSLIFSDNFNDNSLDTTTRWTVTQNAPGSVTESSGQINIVGSNAWNANGMISKLSAANVSGIRLIFDLTTPALAANTDIMVGFSTGGTLNYTANANFYVQIHGVNSHIYAGTPSSSTDTGNSVASNTTYTFRLTMTKSGSTVTALIDIKGGSYGSTWTNVYKNLNFTSSGISTQRVIMQAYSSSVTYVVDNLEVFEIGSHLSFADNFNDNSLNSALWVAQSSGGSITETSSQLQIKGNNTWNANGVISKQSVVGFWNQAVLDVTVPASATANGIIFGWARSSALSYNNANCFEVYINIGHSPHNVRILTDTGTIVETAIDVSLNTVYTFRLTWDYTGTNPSVLVEIKGGAYTNWTQVYSNTNYGDVLNWGQYFQIQVFSSTDTYVIDNFSIYEKTYDYDAVNIGDSLALGNQDGTGTTISQRLQLLNGWLCLNTGIGAQTTTDIAGRFNGDAVYRMAERIFVTAGTNDPYYSPNLTLDQTLANLTTMLNLFNAMPAGTGFTPQLIFGEPPPRSHSNPPSGLTDDQYREWIKKLYAEYREFCVKNSVNLAPSYQEIANTGTNIQWGVVTSMTLTAGGSGYGASGTISASGGGGTGATGNYTASGGIIQSPLNVSAEGTAAYTSNPTLVFSGTGSGATGTGNVTLDDAIAQNYVYLADNVGVHMKQAGYNRMGDMYNVYAVPQRMYRWGNTAYPSVNDESWKWWIWSAGSPTITGNADTGDLNLPQNASADSGVKCFPRTSALGITISPAVSAGSVTIQYRYQATNFDRAAGSPSWNTYTGPVNIPAGGNNLFLQIRLIGASVTTATVGEANVTWQLISGSIRLKDLDGLGGLGTVNKLYLN